MWSFTYTNLCTLFPNREAQLKMTNDEIDYNYYIKVADLMPTPLPQPRIKIIHYPSGEDP